MNTAIPTRGATRGALAGALRRSSAARAVVLAAACLAAMYATGCRADTVASLLGNFTINQYCELHLSAGTATVHYAVVYGQPPALRELHNADADGDGVTTQTERDAYVGTLAPAIADALLLSVDGERVPLHAVRWSSSLPKEQGGFSLRVDIDLEAGQLSTNAGSQHRFEIVNRNFAGNMGWREIVLKPDVGIAVYDTDGFGNSATDGLTQALAALPDAGPLDERSVHGSFDRSSAPAGAKLLGSRPNSAMPSIQPSSAASSGGLALSDTGWIARHTRELIDAISAANLKPQVVLWTLLAALLLRSVHALSPGHGKTIVGAYLIGSRGTARHAAFLGMTVTITHTIGVFALGFATLYASRYIVPEKLFPALSLTSALLVLIMGLVLFIQRIRAFVASRRTHGAREAMVFVPAGMAMAAPGSGIFQHTHVHDGTMHSHGGGPMHSHLPPGASGEKVTWKSLLALGISGGLVPCPSAMVLLLAAVALNKTAYGMVLVLVFSLGLACTLTLVGLAFLHARDRFARPNSNSRWPQLLPILSAALISLLGMALSLTALRSFA